MRVDPAITYRNELVLEKHAINQELKWPITPGCQEWMFMIQDKERQEKSSALVSLVICIYLCIMSILLLIRYNYYGIALLSVNCMNDNETTSNKRVLELINWNLYSVIYITHVFKINRSS